MALHKPWLTLGGSIILASLTCWFLPLFHVRPLRVGPPGGDRFQESRSGGATSAGQSLSAQSSATQTPSGQTTSGLSVPHTLDALTARATLTQLWNAFDKDATDARKQFGQQVGLGGAWYFCVSGSGTVESVEPNRVVLAIDGTTRRVRLELGVVVDSTVREAAGIKASQFENAQDFNALSAELNRQVEEQVIKAHRHLLSPGASVSFVGCAKVSGAADLDPLSLVPVRLEVKSDQAATPAASEQVDGDARP